MKERWERITAFIKHYWVFLSELGLIVAVVLFVPLLCFEIPIATCAQLLFSALLVFISFRLCSTQEAFNKYVRDRDTPDLIPVGLPKGKVGSSTIYWENDRETWETKLFFIFRVTNPAPTIAELWKVHIENSELSNQSWEMINWGEGPIEVTEGPREPALVMPNQIITIVFRGSVDQETVKKAATIKKLKWRFDYRIGNYETSTEYERDVTTKEQ